MPAISNLEIQEAFDLSNNSTLRIKAVADRLAMPKNKEELVELFKLVKENNWQWNLLGAGSNTLLSSRAMPGLTILTTELKKMTELGDGFFKVEAGVKMPRFCAEMTKLGFSGAEFMEGIPGTIAGGVVMNAGAHGSWVELILEEAEVLNLETLDFEVWQRDDFEFSYRSSKIDPKKHFVFTATFKLVAADKHEIRETVKLFNSQRSNAQPIKAFTCGCTFKNPGEECRAGILIDELGAKGMELGGIQVSEKHANFFENHQEAKATSMDFCKLMAKIQKLAMDERAIKLSPEVQTMGYFTEEELRIWA